MPSPDVLLVGLGSTHGLRVAEDELAGSLHRAGAEVVLARARRPREVRTFALTDLGWALAARRAAAGALARDDPRAVLYLTTTAALLWPRPGAIRFDAPAAANRPGRHGIWQRPLERRRLAQAPLLVPQDPGALAEAGAPPTPAIVVPIPVEPSAPEDGAGAPERDVAAVTYAANPAKKGLDRVLAAWDVARAPGETLVVAGLHGADRDGVRYAGTLPGPAFRALLRRARVYVTAPRREDYGIAQLEALADGCRVVTTPAPGPYAALPLLAGGVGWVADDALLPGALRSALDADEPGYAARALAAIAPFRRAAVDRVVAERLLPALLAGR
ncbi:glycosyltransferase family 4 protein [Baekduia soli]|uniref:Glycosyltransferase family 4 protein n=1 Tax=Baekduia soli TaxID=496014 RepID=A0A5B8U0V4_9ACTN|nr:glycosyltransferase [Baekduia soli]QEC46617.1 glycosyltransferase family 4 protein [Baekduia soli]